MAMVCIALYLYIAAAKSDRRVAVALTIIENASTAYLIMSDSTSVTMILQNDDTSAAQRFTLFHEAFHILAHYRTTPVFRKRGAI